MKLRTISAAVLFALSSMTLAVHADGLRRPYIIQLADKPIASYDGSIAGLAATRPVTGNRLNFGSANVQLYNNYLGGKQATVQAAIAGAPITYNYSVVLNGFAAMLTDDEVRALQARSDVAAVTADTPRHMVTTATPHFLGLDQPGGLWAKLGGKGSAGENIVIGILDGGAWPENPGYADRVDANGKPTFDASGTLVYGAPPATWKGICQTGEGFTSANCNNKLIGAQYFDATYLSQPLTTHWTEFRSPRDSIGGTVGHGGHGTHTSTTAGGNNGPDAIVAGIDLGQASGMAPRARIAMYKICWTYNDNTDATGGKNSCFTGDSVAAIEKAVVDGVNVLNYSISGGGTVTDPVEQAFLHASNAGVFVAASAGNDGPANAVAHVSPWLATVAASTHSRQFQANALLGNGASYTGASLNVNPLPASPIVRAVDAGVAGANPTSVSLCYSADANNGLAVLDPAKVQGKIVTCLRGGNGRVDKSLAVLQAGGVGMIMVDNGAGLVSDVHAVPTVHVTAADGAAINAYAAAQTGTASITRFVVGVSPVPAPTVADFSSRGPNQYDPNVLKPDLAAPGVDIIAGVTPELTPEQRTNVINGTLIPGAAWAAYQGTSMASPHVAGVGALLKQAHPSWSPAMIKSALMTSATDTYADTEEGDLRGQLPFGQGAGHIDPNRANDPGLVYDLLQADYKRYMCGAGVASECAGGAAGTIAGYNLNLPSITIGNVLGNVVVTRKVTNVSDTASTYNARMVVPAGFTATVAPARLTLAPGASASYTVTVARQANVVQNQWQYGSLTWNDGVHAVRSPMTLRAGASVLAPALVQSNQVTAAKTLGVTTGFSGKMSAAYGGLKEVSKASYTVSQAPDGSFDSLELVRLACAAGGTGVRLVPVAIPAGTVVASFELFNADTEGGSSDDLDLAVLDSADNLVAYSGHGGSNEVVRLASPGAGSYRVCVQGYGLANQVQTTFALSSAVVTTADRNGGFRALVPSTVYAGSSATVSTSWSGLAAGKRYYGAVQLKDSSGVIGATTIYQVETDGAVPVPEPEARPSVKDRGM
ncbi:S8 family serine peptidase [Massilia sp. S19_KUP03_FR1]|uniref:S8 family serine peptidase n=1 Tax=Massilia sp. S19_KUP03_FR1 TaxID=3025503 RepID=UPI002FCCCEB0